MANVPKALDAIICYCILLSLLSLKKTPTYRIAFTKHSKYFCLRTLDSPLFVFYIYVYFVGLSNNKYT